MQLSNIIYNMQIFFILFAKYQAFFLILVMENGLIVLIFIASLVYKIYSSYKEEMAKAAKRNPQKRPATVPTIPIPPTAASTIPSIEKNTYSQENVIRNPFADIPEEVRRVQESKVQQQIKRASKNQPSESSTKDVVPKFDLRQAVIQSTILERPYK